MIKENKLLADGTESSQAQIPAKTFLFGVSDEFIFFEKMIYFSLTRRISEWLAG
jgi:hypothetical protein